MCVSLRRARHGNASSGAGISGRFGRESARHGAARLLRHEVRALEAAGVRTVVFAPSPAEQEVMDDDMMSRHRLDEVIQQSFIAAGARAARPGVAELIRTAAAAGDR